MLDHHHLISGNGVQIGLTALRFALVWRRPEKKQPCNILFMVDIMGYTLLNRGLWAQAET